jgi:dipeptidyl aminopeptidase/acylaminoacyl peptidase
MSNRICAQSFPLVCLTITAGPSSAKRNITQKDLFDFVWIGNPQIAPDGARVAYVRVTVNEKKDGYDTAIWMVPTAGDEARQLTSGPRDTGPRWSPDGKFLVFSRAIERDGKKQPPQLCLLPMSGGDAFIFTDLQR